MQPKLIKEFSDFSDNLITKWENTLCSLSPIKLDEDVGFEMQKSGEAPYPC